MAFTVSASFQVRHCIVERVERGRRVCSIPQHIGVRSVFPQEQFDLGVVEQFGLLHLNPHLLHDADQRRQKQQAQGPDDRQHHDHFQHRESRGLV